MKDKRVILYDVNMQINIGHLLINVLNINYEPPVPMRYFNLHSHSSYEFHFVPQGKGNLRIGKNNYAITPGTFYLTGPGIYHEQTSDQTEPMVEYCLNLDIKLSNKPSQKNQTFPAIEVLTLENILLNTHFWIGQDPYNSWLLVKKMLDEYENPQLGYYLNIESLITQLIINAVRCFDNHRIVSYRQQIAASAENRRRTMDSYFRNYYKPLKPASLADSLNVSVRQLERLIHQYYGMTFKEKLIKTRLDVAKDLLQNTDLSIDAISDKTGFSSLSHFSKIFSQYEGISPSLFRKKV